MNRRCVTFALSALTKTRPQQLFKYNNHTPKSLLTDVRLCRSVLISSSKEYSTENLKKIGFDEMKRLTNDKNVLIIDVREPQELIDHGVLPGSINIPLGDVETTLKNLSNEQFKKKYGCDKPDKNTPLVFSCMIGRRSETAQVQALQLGYKDVTNYIGGWKEWAKKIKE